MVGQGVDGAGMSASVETRSAVRGARSQSLFYRDLGASPATRASSVRGNVGTPNQTGIALWRENVGGGVDPPPPPFYTLEDRIERSPEPATDLSFRSPDPKFAEKNTSFNSRTVHSSLSGRGGSGLPYGDSQGGQGSPATPQQSRVSRTSSWLAPQRERGADNREPGNREGSSPLPGVLQHQQSGGLLTLSAPRERSEFLAAGAAENHIEGEEWVTVFGFGVDETNAVVREFEKCGSIVNQVSGPGGANWVHIRYQTYYDAQKAFQKNGIQLNGALIVGVKPLDPLQHQALTEKVNQGGLPLLGLPLRTPTRSTATAVQPSRWSYLQSAEAGGPTPRSLSVMASPAKSTLSRLVDVVFGM